MKNTEQMVSQSAAQIEMQKTHYSDDPRFSTMSTQSATSGIPMTPPSQVSSYAPPKQERWERQMQKKFV